jgi:predicted amidophosphoribosyltransferase
MENLKGAFALRKPVPDIASFPGIILVDDVFTTGSTVDECAKVLRKAGAGRIAVLTVMRG